MRINLLVGTGIVLLLASTVAAAAPPSRPATEEIVAAAQRNDLPRVKELLGPSTRPANATDESGMGALHWAAYNGNLEMAQLLLDRGAEVNLQSKAQMPYYGGYDHYRNGKQTPLLLATGRGNTAVARLLLEHGAEVDVANQFGGTPVDLAAATGNAELLEMLLAENAPIQPATRPAASRPALELFGEGRRTWSVLHLAAESGSPAVVKLLLAKGQSPAQLDDQRQTPLHALLSASEMGQRLAGMGYTEMGQSSRQIDEGAAKEKLARGDRAAVLRLLIEAGADVNATDGAGHTPLYYARKAAPGSELEKLLVDKGAQLSLWDATRLGDAARIEQILKQTPKAVDDSDPLGRTPLALAAGDNALDTAKLLLDRGAKVDAVRARDGSSGVLYGAIERNNTDLLDLLLDYRKQIGDPIYFGALWYALNIGRDELATRLLKHLGDLDLTHSSALLERVVEDPHRMTMLKQLLKAGVPVDDGRPLARQPLTHAAEVGNADAIRELLAASPAVLKKRNGEYNQLLFSDMGGRSEALEVLIDAGLDVNARDAGGNTPLHAAVWRNTPACAKLLLSHGVDVHAKNKDGKTALDLAADKHPLAGQESLETIIKDAIAKEK